MPGRKIKILKTDLYKFYHKENKSTVAIAKLYGCHNSTVSLRLREFGILTRYRYKISKQDLYRLYYQKNKSTIKIAKIYNCNHVTISNRLNEFNIPRKSICQARIHYPRYDFNEDLSEKAYLIGFRIGDLRVYKTRPHSETVIVQGHTTKKVQAMLLKKLFSKYGKVSITRSKDGTLDINCFLNTSFHFLLPKKDDIEVWISKDKKFFAAFMAGYIDAEGSFTINQGKARFQVATYDKTILHKIHHWLIKRKINSKFRLIGKKGELRSDGYHYNNDLWRLNVNEAHSLLELINGIKPFIRHGKRLKDINIALRNLKERKQRGTI